ncbi:MAG: hypothetical protein IJJ26_01045 [Victivallales bacterium]|nr:hypothetical protein [Victivallales bacterium]
MKKLFLSLVCLAVGLAFTGCHHHHHHTKKTEVIQINRPYHPAPPPQNHKPAPHPYKPLPKPNKPSHNHYQPKPGKY